MVGKKQRFKVIDIFAGPGGLGEGFMSFSAGGAPSFDIAISIEKDQIAHRTLTLRSFFRKFTQAPDKYWQYARGEITRNELFASYPREAEEAEHEAQCLELGSNNHAVVRKEITTRLGDTKQWVLIGGPPCQAYSLVGRSRMSVREDFEEDERHFLYKEYLRILADHRPPVFVMENVKGLLSAKHGGEKIIGRIFKDLKKPGRAIRSGIRDLEYRLYSFTAAGDEDQDPNDFLVKAEQYGIPQTRHRVLILGVRSDINATPRLLKKRKAPTVDDVIGDLPMLRSGLSKELDLYETWQSIISRASKDRWVRDTDLTDIVQHALSAQKQIVMDRGSEYFPYKGKPKHEPKWYRAQCPSGIMNHASRSHMQSDIERYFFSSAFAQKHARPAGLKDFPTALLPAHRNVGRALDTGHFSDRFRVQLKNAPSTTITSHISKDGHYFIHYDPVQCRSLTVREAARLQTFPDNYKFEGNRTAQYHQVGNAVPPLLARQLAEIVYDILLAVEE